MRERDIHSEREGGRERHTYTERVTHNLGERERDKKIARVCYVCVG